ncbi:MAG: formate--tetrahydrofolate ligase, partial [Gemmatimonadetes bacterium]|nr:formate--tetrahydrofolate ligase [Gemmatimonadota bacterium]
MRSDLDIARAAAPKQITQIAADLGLSPDDIDLYGRYKAKVHLDLPEKGEPAGGAKYVVVTAMTPTTHGEGKTTTTVGLSQALNALGERSIATIRQPSMGPTFGIKGGAAGGGKAQVIPMEELNLHLTGDIHAVTSAHSLLAAAVDARLYHEERLDDRRLGRRGLKRLDIDPGAGTWKRVVDMGDRALRDIVVSDGGEGVRRRSGYDISAASEVMAILALASGLP